MSKSILVIDTPSSCEKCNFQQFAICHAVRKSICGTPTDLKSKPDWCPLRELPEKKEIRLDHALHEYERGYNACIDELLKGEEG